MFCVWNHSFIETKATIKKTFTINNMKCSAVRKDFWCLTNKVNQIEQSPDSDYCPLIDASSSDQHQRCDTLIRSDCLKTSAEAEAVILLIHRCLMVLTAVRSYQVDFWAVHIHTACPRMLDMLEHWEESHDLTGKNRCWRSVLWFTFFPNSFRADNII